MNWYEIILNDLSKFDSIAWTGTKCLGLPQQCAVLITKHVNALYKCNASKQDYLFHTHEEMDFDLGEKSLNCGRRNDCLKLWVSWKINGDEVFVLFFSNAKRALKSEWTTLLPKLTTSQKNYKKRRMNFC